MVRTYVYNSSIQSSITFDDYNACSSRSLNDLNRFGVVPSLIYTPPDGGNVNHLIQSNGLYRSNSLFTGDHYQIHPVQAQDVIIKSDLLNDNGLTRVTSDAPDLQRIKENLHETSDQPDKKKHFQKQPNSSPRGEVSYLQRQSTKLCNGDLKAGGGKRAGTRSPERTTSRNGSQTPFWLRGNPQPKTGVRGSELYNQALFGRRRPATKDPAQHKFAQFDPRATTKSEPILCVQYK